MGDQASILILAGSETTAVALAFCTYYLLDGPAVMAHLRQELQAQFQHEADITSRTVNQLPDLHAVIQEALRLNPPTTKGFPRQVPSQGATVDGHHIPGQVSLTLSRVCSGIG
jgi:cytochrome P450